MNKKILQESTRTEKRNASDQKCMPKHISSTSKSTLYMTPFHALNVSNDVRRDTIIEFNLESINLIYVGETQYVYNNTEFGKLFSKNTHAHRTKKKREENKICGKNDTSTEASAASSCLNLA